LLGGFAVQRAGTALDESALVVPREIRRSARSRRRRWLLGVAGLLVLIGLLALIAPWRRSEPLFRTSPLAKRSITRYVEATGRLDVLRRVEVAPPLPGQLVESLVEPRQEVSEGQPLARLDERSAGIALRSARAGLESATSREAEARAAHGGARENLERVRRLAGRGLASSGEVSAAEASEAQARAALSAAEAEREIAAQNLAEAKLQKELRTIVAPIDGLVLDAPNSLLTIATPEAGPLFVIGSSLERLRINASVAESDIGQVKQGQHATFTVPAYPDRAFEAVVEHLAVDSSRSAGGVMYEVRLGAANPERLLLPGMTTTLRIEVGHADNVLVVREAALRFNPEAEASAPAAPRSRVWRLRSGDRVEPVQVIAGLSDGTFTEIRPKQPDALKVGDPIVLGWSRQRQGDARGPGISLGTR
jgi:HlyD family secretion protein